jgi:hypothetical protein
MGALRERSRVRSEHHPPRRAHGASPGPRFLALARHSRGASCTRAPHRLAQIRVGKVARGLPTPSTHLRPPLGCPTTAPAAIRELFLFPFLSVAVLKFKNRGGGVRASRIRSYRAVLILRNPVLFFVPISSKLLFGTAPLRGGTRRFAKSRRGGGSGKLEGRIGEGGCSLCRACQHTRARSGLSRWYRRGGHTHTPGASAQEWH